EIDRLVAITNSVHHKEPSRQCICGRHAPHHGRRLKPSSRKSQQPPAPTGPTAATSVANFYRMNQLLLDPPVRSPDYYSATANVGFWSGSVQRDSNGNWYVTPGALTVPKGAG